MSTTYLERPLWRRSSCPRRKQQRDHWVALARWGQHGKKAKLTYPSESRCGCVDVRNGIQLKKMWCIPMEEPGSSVVGHESVSDKHSSSQGVSWDYSPEGDVVARETWMIVSRSLANHSVGLTSVYHVTDNRIFEVVVTGARTPDNKKVVLYMVD